jgi:8-amino-7-oxononanoate synthase
VHVHPIRERKQLKYMPADLSARQNNKLNRRKEDGGFRSLPARQSAIDICSNDYLGFSVRPEIADHIQLKLAQYGQAGSTGSRLLTGNHSFFEEVEKRIAEFHDVSAALVFGSGYEANSGLVPAVCGKDDIILFDELCHASLREGIRLSFAGSISFRHNDLDHLRSLLEDHQDKDIYIITESVFSMDGDICPLQELVGLAESYRARIILDEAHAFGVLGDRGGGLAQSLSLHQQVFARIMTYGKGGGIQGAAVLGSEGLKDYLVNFCRTFIYTTAPMVAQFAAIDAVYGLLRNRDASLVALKEIIGYANEIGFGDYRSDSAIRIVRVDGNEKVTGAALELQENGFWVLPVRSPTVLVGKERLRFCLHAFNTRKELDKLAGLLPEYSR